MGISDVLNGYAAEATRLVTSYEALQTPAVLGPVADWLPDQPSRVLDVGAGTGRNAAWLAGRGHQVTAVEPIDRFRSAGAKLHADAGIAWISDTLPLLRQLGDTSRFDLILVVGVWQHLEPQDHSRAMRRLASLLAPGAHLLMSLRHGPGAASRPCYPADPDALVADAGKSGLSLHQRRPAASIQKANRDLGVTWTWLALGRH